MNIFCEKTARKVPRGKSIAEHPLLALEYAGDEDPRSIHAGSQKKRRWRCSNPDCAHTWLAAGYSRVAGHGCPACAERKNSIRKRTPKGDSIAEHPQLSAEYIGEVDPQDIRAGTHDILRWKCSAPGCVQVWEASGNSRASGGQGCPGCWAKRRGAATREPRGDSVAEHPLLSLEYTGSEDPAGIRAGTATRLPWRCAVPGCGNLWVASGASRVLGHGCPKCNRSGSYRPTEHLFNAYLQAFLQLPEEDVDPKQSKLPSITGRGRGFQIDARFWFENRSKLIAIFYDGYAGHNDTEKSVSRDIERRTAILNYAVDVAAGISVRHGMLELPLLHPKHVQVSAGLREPLLTIATRTVERLRDFLLLQHHLTLGISPVSDVEGLFERATETWKVFGPARKQALIQGAITTERRWLKYAAERDVQANGYLRPVLLQEGDSLHSRVAP